MKNLALLAALILVCPMFGQTYSPLGTYSTATLSTSVTQSVTVGSNTKLLAACNIGSTSAGTPTWNGLSMTLNLGYNYNASNKLYIWSLTVISGGTANFTVSWSGSHDATCVFSSVTGLSTVGALDKSADAMGTSSSPSSGNTSTTSQANEFLYGIVAAQYSGALTMGSPAWSNSFTAGQTAGNSVAGLPMTEGYNTVSSTGAYAAAMTGLTTTSLIEWGAAIVTYKLVAQSCGVPSLALLGAGCQ